MPTVGQPEELVIQLCATKLNAIKFKRIGFSGR